jgi:hypothetical protein
LIRFGREFRLKEVKGGCPQKIEHERNIMKRWAVIVAILYSLMLAVLSLPFVVLAFVPETSLTQAAEMYSYWQWWLWLTVMGLAQAAMLAVPVRFASRRPMSHRPLALTILAGGLMMGGLATGAIYSLIEFAVRDHGGNWTNWTAIGLGIVAWCIWALIFFRFSRTAEPQDLVSRQCKCLLKGSILELLIAVPTHIVARCRDYCCAGFMTFIGLTLGMSVMLFSFGPGVFFLFVARWRRLHPGQGE